MRISTLVIFFGTLIGLISQPPSAHAQFEPQLLYSITGNPGSFSGDALACTQGFVGSGISSIVIGSPGAESFEVRDGATGTTVIASDFGMGDGLGSAVSAGDDMSVGGGTFTDIIVGGPQGSPSFARVYGGPDGANSFSTFFNSFSSAPGLGASVSPLFDDRNANGRNDFIYGAPDSGSDGVIFIDDVLSTFSTFSVFGSTPNENLGRAVASIQDLSGDGIRDLLAGAPRAEIVGNRVGAVRAYNSVTAAPLFEVTGDFFGDLFGYSLAALGDVDGNGFEDFLVGAPNEDGITPGYARLFSNNATNTPTTLCTFNGVVNGDEVGRSVAALGDINSDGFEEFAVGAPGSDGSFGSVRIYHYNQSSGSCVLLHTIVGQSPDDRVGVSLAGKGSPSSICDLNSDGIADFGIGSRFDDNNSGSVDFYIGVPLPTPTPTPTATPSPTPTATAVATPTAPFPREPNRSRLTFRINQNGRMLVSNRFNRLPSLPSSCTVSLYGRTSRADLSDAGPVLTLARGKAAPLRILRFNARRLQRAHCDSRGVPFSIHLITEARCGEGPFFSNVFARQASCGLAPSLMIRDWEAQIQQRVR